MKTIHRAKVMCRTSSHLTGTEAESQKKSQNGARKKSSVHSPRSVKKQLSELHAESAKTEAT